MQGVLIGAVTVAVVLLGALFFQRSRAMLAQVKDSEIRFRLAMKHSSIGMALLSPKGEWQAVNHALCDLAGYDEAGLLSTSFQDISHPDDLLKSRGMLADLLAGDITGYSLEQRFITRRGDDLWVRLSVSAVRVEGQVSYLIAQVENIHAARLSEQALQESRQRLQMALEVGGVGIWQY
ncbi:PAS domain S-box protein, partial [Alcanivorax sp. HI0083]